MLLLAIHSRLILVLKDPPRLAVGSGAIHEAAQHLACISTSSLQCHLLLLRGNEGGIFQDANFCNWGKGMKVKIRVQNGLIVTPRQKSAPGRAMTFRKRSKVGRVGHSEYIPCRAMTFRKMKPPPGRSTSTFTSGVPCIAALRFHPSEQTRIPAKLLLPCKCTHKHAILQVFMATTLMQKYEGHLPSYSPTTFSALCPSSPCTRQTAGSSK